MMSDLCKIIVFVGPITDYQRDGKMMAYSNPDKKSDMK